MKFADLIKKGSLTQSARGCSNISNCSRSKGSNVAGTFKNKINKSSNSSNTYLLSGEDKPSTHIPAATATPAIPATEEKPLPYLDVDGSLVIPFGSDPSYHWWNGGQSIENTENEARKWKH